MYIVGVKNKQGQEDEVLYQSGYYLTGDPSEDIILKNTVLKFGGNVTDYAVFFINEKSETYEKIIERDAFYKLKWTPENNVSGIDFTEYENWGFIGVSADKYVLDPNETANITLQVLIKNKQAVDTNFNSTINFEYLKGRNKIISESVMFTSGVGSLSFTPVESGTYLFPYKMWTDRKNMLRVDTQIKLKVRIVFSDPPKQKSQGGGR